MKGEGWMMEREGGVDDGSREREGGEVYDGRRERRGGEVDGGSREREGGEGWMMVGGMKKCYWRVQGRESGASAFNPLCCMF